VVYKGKRFDPEHYKPEQLTLLLRGLYQFLKAGEIEPAIKLTLLLIIF
jgi:hypothetical protein